MKKTYRLDYIDNVEYVTSVGSEMHVFKAVAYLKGQSFGATCQFMHANDEWHVLVDHCEYAFIRCSYVFEQMVNPDCADIMTINEFDESSLGSVNYLYGFFTPIDSDHMENILDGALSDYENSLR